MLTVESAVGQEETPSLAASLIPKGKPVVITEFDYVTGNFVKNPLLEPDQCACPSLGIGKIFEVSYLWDNPPRCKSLSLGKIVKLGSRGNDEILVSVESGRSFQIKLCPEKTIRTPAAAEQAQTRGRLAGLLSYVTGRQRSIQSIEPAAQSAE